MWGIYGGQASITPQPKVGDTWVNKTDPNFKIFLEKTNDEVTLYCAVSKAKDGSLYVNWFTKEHILDLFIPWVDPNAAQKKWAAQHGYVWRDPDEPPTP